MLLVHPCLRSFLLVCGESESFGRIPFYHLSPSTPYDSSSFCTHSGHFEYYRAASHWHLSFGFSQLTPVTQAFKLPKVQAKPSQGQIINLIARLTKK
jgi:hypothetical protein